MLEFIFHSIVADVKRLYMQVGEGYYERDYKNDITEGYLAMHTFINPHFYFYLECQLTYDYHIEWSVNNCTYLPHLLKLFDQHPFDLMSTRMSLKPDFATFFDRTMEPRNAAFIYSFKG